MKILLTSFWYMPMTGGIGTYLSNLKDGLKYLGHEVDIFGQQSGVHGYYTLNDTSILPKQTVRQEVARAFNPYLRHFAPETPARIKVLEINRYSFELAAAYFNLEQYDLIHCQDVISAQALHRVKPASVPLITTIHGCYTYELYLTRVLTKKDLNWQYQAAQEFLGVTASTMTISPSHWLRNVMSEQFRVPKDRITVVPYGIDTRLFLNNMNKPATLSFPAGKRLIVCPARLDPVKGHETLLQALGKLKWLRQDWVCLLLGDGSTRNKLEALQQQLGLKRYVFFMGNRDDVPAIVSSADLIVLPSLQDNQPFAIMEAQIAGKPVVVSNAGGIPEMVKHGETGLMFPKGRSDVLANNLATLLNNPMLGVRLGEKGKYWAMKQWSLNRMLRDTVAVYTMAMAQSPNERTIDDS